MIYFSAYKKLSGFRGFISAAENSFSYKAHFENFRAFLLLFLLRGYESGTIFLF